MQHDTMDMADDAIPVDGLVERALSAVRALSDAREANEEGAARILNAYETVRNANVELSEDLQAREMALAAATERGTRQEAEILRLKALSREALAAVQTAQDERDRAREEVRVHRENHDKLSATHENLIATNAKLMSAFEKLLNEVGTGSRVIRDGSRRLSDFVVPTPARPRAPRQGEAASAETQLERDMRETTQQIGARTTPPRLVASDGALRRGDDEILEPGDRAGVDDLLGRLAASGRVAG